MSDGPQDDRQHRRPHTPPIAAPFLEFDLTGEDHVTELQGSAGLRHPRD